MNHKPIILNNISFQIDSKICFEDFSTKIYSGRKIAIMGINGTGKSTLLKIIQGKVEPTSGTVEISPEIIFGYVPQTVTEYPELSGGQRFNKALSQALSLNPDVLCLDEPTNHLDLSNKCSLIKMLQRYTGTLLIVSHDPEILKLDFDEIWHIEHANINIFSGNYSEYLKMHKLKKEAITTQREQAHKEKHKLRKLIQKEHKRSSQSRSANKEERDKALLGAMKESGSQTAGKNIRRLSKIEENIKQKLSDSFVHKKIEPNFNINAYKISFGKSVVSIINGSCGYRKPILTNINFQLLGGNKVAIIGDNGTGKSTFIKAILKDPTIELQGEWRVPDKTEIGYLDQHYSTLDSNLSVFEVIKKAAQNWTDEEIRKHLNDFLFFTQEDISKKAMNLSGGEKARLCLAQIAAKNPSLLLLDEITNNIDLETRKHVIEVFKAYPGAMIAVTHDPEFLKALEIHSIYETKDGKLNYK